MLYIDLDVHHGDGVQAIHWTTRALTFSIHETGRALFRGPVTSTRSGRGCGRERARERARAAGHGRRGVARRGHGAAPRTGRRVRARPHRVAARRGSARVGSAGPPQRDHDGPRLGCAAGRLAGAPARTRPMARDRRWRLRRVSGGTTHLGADPLAGAHREVPATTPPAWRDRWAAEAARYGRAARPSASTTNSMLAGTADTAQAAAEERAIAIAAPVRACSCRGSSRSGATAAGSIPSSPRPVMPSRAGHRDADDPRRCRRRDLDGAVAGPVGHRPADPQRAHALVLAVADGARDRGCRRDDGLSATSCLWSSGWTARPMEPLRVAVGLVDGARRNCWHSVSRPTTPAGPGGRDPGGPHDRHARQHGCGDRRRTRRPRTARSGRARCDRPTPPDASWLPGRGGARVHPVGR